MKNKIKSIFLFLSLSLIVLTSSSQNLTLDLRYRTIDFDKEIGKGMVKNCLVKLFEYLKITQLESFFPMVEDMLGSQLTEYLVENYLQ